MGNRGPIYRRCPGEAVGGVRRAAHILQRQTRSRENSGARKRWRAADTIGGDTNSVTIGDGGEGVAGEGGAGEGSIKIQVGTILERIGTQRSHYAAEAVSFRSYRLIAGTFERVVRQRIAAGRCGAEGEQVEGTSETCLVEVAAGNGHCAIVIPAMQKSGSSGGSVENIG